MWIWFQKKMDSCTWRVYHVVFMFRVCLLVWLEWYDFETWWGFSICTDWWWCLHFLRLPYMIHRKLKPTYCRISLGSCLYLMIQILLPSPPRPTIHHPPLSHLPAHAHTHTEVCTSHHQSHPSLHPHTTLRCCNSGESWCSDLFNISGMPLEKTPNFFVEGEVCTIYSLYYIHWGCSQSNQCFILCLFTARWH